MLLAADYRTGRTVLRSAFGHPDPEPQNGAAVTLFGVTPTLDGRVQNSHAVGGDLGRQQQGLVEQGVEAGFLDDGPDSGTRETRRAMVGLEPDSPHDLGVHISQCPLNGGNNPTGTLAQSAERYDYGGTVCPLDR